MRQTDIVIAGGGAAGSLAAAMLGRAGYVVVLIDPHTVYPFDFRCEKIDGAQLAILRKTGLAEAVERASTNDRETWVARYGRMLDKRPGDQLGFLYETLVNTLRAAIPAGATFIAGKVSDITTSDDRQTVTLASGEAIAARLVIVANGLNIGLRHKLGMEKQELSACHSISLGFDLLPVGRDRFAFPAMTYYAERPEDRTAYITLFPIGSTMRANLMTYRDMDDPWLRQMRHEPAAGLSALMPKLEGITGPYEVGGPVRIRPADLYLTTGIRQPGVVLVGDAFGTSCPAAGTGVGRVFMHVERLCNVHIPHWFATPGMDADKIAAFYDDPVKANYDAACLNKAFALRSLSVEPGLPWAAQRITRFALRYAIGTLHATQRALSSKPAERRREGDDAEDVGLGRAA